MATTPSEEHLGFGHGIQACPGRFFAVNEIKLILVYFLMNSEFKQSEKQQKSRLHFPFKEYLVLNYTLSFRCAGRRVSSRHVIQKAGHALVSRRRGRYKLECTERVMKGRKSLRCYRWLVGAFRLTSSRNISNFLQYFEKLQERSLRKL
jgi:hypothetical protein